MPRTEKDKLLTVGAKLDIVEAAKKTSIHIASAKYNVDRKSVRLWMEQEPKLKNMSAYREKTVRKRLQGGERKVKDPQVEDDLYKWVLEERSNKRPVSRTLMLAQAKRIFAEKNEEFTRNMTWISRFMARIGLSLRRKTTTAQRPPLDFVQKIADFILYVRNLRGKEKYPLSSIYGCDETAVWFDMPVEKTVEKTGAKDVGVLTTGHEKMRMTVMLTASADGKKLKPFVLLNRKRPVKELEMFKHRMVINYEGTNLMNQALTANYIQVVLGNNLFGRRLLVWDSFACHIEERVKKDPARRKIDMAVVPGGCTKYVQPADVSWNKPLKDRLRGFYTEWLASGNMEYTKGGNLRPVALKTLCQWIVDAWEALPPELIVKSFKVCGITIALDGSEDDQIAVFKEGRDCEHGLHLLKEWRIIDDQELEEDEMQALDMMFEDGYEDAELMDFDGISAGPSGSIDVSSDSD